MGGSIEQIGLHGLALAFAGYAGALDWRYRRIPNWLTVPGLAAGLALSTAAGGWGGAKASLQGSGLALALLLPFVIARGLGAGDWKLMGALGSFLGPYRLMAVLLGTILIAGLMAAVQMIGRRRVQETLRNLVVLVRAFATFRVPSLQAISLDNPRLMKLPFGVAAAIAMAISFLLQSALKLF